MVINGDDSQMKSEVFLLFYQILPKKRFLKNGMTLPKNILAERHRRNISKIERLLKKEADAFLNKRDTYFFHYQTNSLSYLVEC